MTKITTRNIIKGGLVILAVVISFFLLFHFIKVATLVFTGIVISIAMEPIVGRLHNLKLPRSLSVIIIYFCLLSLFIVFIFLIIPQTIQQTSNLLPKFESTYIEFRSALLSSRFPFIHQLLINFPMTLSSIFTAESSSTTGNLTNSFNKTVEIARSIFGGLFAIGAVLLIGFYWTLEGERVEYAFSLLFPVEKRDSMRETLIDIKAWVGGFVRGQGLLALAISIMSLAAYSIIGLPSVVSLAIAAGLFELIPLFGPTLGALPALIMALASSPPIFLWVILTTILIQLFENHFLSPLIMKRTVRVNPIVTILSIIGFGYLLGFPGLLMAIPLAAIFQVFIDRVFFHAEVGEIKSVVGRDSPSELRYEAKEFVQDIRRLIRRKEASTSQEDGDEIEDRIESIATDLDGLLAQISQPDNQT